MRIITGVMVFAVGFILALTKPTPAPLATKRGDDLTKTLIAMVNSKPFPEVIRLVKKAFPVEEQWMHNAVGHILGEAAYRRYGERAFALCDPFFNQGCYHGVLELIARMRGPDPLRIETLKTACEQSVRDRSTCSHPLGHAATALNNYDIEKALAACDGFYPQENAAAPCWMGALMEYNDRASAAKLPLTQCIRYADKYWGQCAKLLMSRQALDGNSDFAKLFAYCTSYGRDSIVRPCVDELGYRIAQANFFAPLRALSACAAFGTYRDNCILGIVRTYRTTDQPEAARFACGALENTDDRTNCLTI